MRKKIIFFKRMFWVFSLLILSAAPLFAEGEKEFVTSESTRNSYRQAERSLTPNERIARNERKVQQNPSLRGRWNPKSRQAASEDSYIRDNLSEKILSNFREDEAIAKLPVKLKVSSAAGVVTLNGVVNNPDERTLIEEKATKMEGVKKVVNNLKIKTSDKDLLD